MATFSELTESIKQSALALDQSALRLNQDPQNEDKIEQAFDLIDSIRGDLDKLDDWIDRGCPSPEPEER